MHGERCDLSRAIWWSLFRGPEVTRSFLRWILGALLAASLPAAAETLLYATAIKVHYEDGAARIECNLYRVDPATGASTLLAPVRIQGREPVGVISLAIHPGTGVVYGVTAGLAADRPRSLVSINPGTGDVTVIGPLGEVASDLAFSRESELFAWLPARNQLATVNVNTGRVTPLGESGITGLMGGGMAIDDRGVAYVAATGATGTLDTVDTLTGRGTAGPPLEGAPYLSAITNLTFGPDGTLYAVNSNMGSPASTALVSIDVASGKVRDIGRLPNDAHALIFGPPGNDLAPSTLGLLVGIGAIVLLGLGLWLMGRRRR
jgi:hypothetical protein